MLPGVWGSARIAMIPTPDPLRLSRLVAVLTPLHTNHVSPFADAELQCEGALLVIAVVALDHEIVEPGEPVGCRSSIGRRERDPHIGDRSLGWPLRPVALR